MLREKETQSSIGSEAMSRVDQPTESRPSAGRWRVIDVMETDVITIERNTSCKQIARLLADNDLSAVPVVSGGGRVLGMVSEADVLRREERSFSRLGAGLRLRTHRERKQAEALTAAELMTSPAITIHPDAPLGAAVRLMNAHHVRRLPVVSPSGDLIGIVSRQDLLRAFLRPDSEIAAEIADALTAIPRAQSMRIAVFVTDGEVVLTGNVPAASLIAAAVSTASDVEGVVAVTSMLTETREARQAK
jgi:CBS-domain-containing membrane protein